VGDSFRFLAAALTLSSSAPRVFARNSGKIVDEPRRSDGPERRQAIPTGDAQTQSRSGRNGMQIRVHKNSVQNATGSGPVNGSRNGQAPPAERPISLDEGPITAKTILITSPGPDEGKTTTVANLAAAFAELGQKVIVLSCDFRRPSIHEHFGLINEDGLSDALGKEMTGPVLNGNVKETFVKNVSVLPSGTASERPGELLSSERMRLALTEARSQADIVLLDSPPLMTAGEATLLIREVDGVLVLCRSGKTTADAAERGAEVLKRLNAPLIGAALTDSEGGVLPYYYPIRESKRALAWFARD
jgi:capsular exopolysaccharide synthesis family protein